MSKSVDLNEQVMTLPDGTQSPLLTYFNEEGDFINIDGNPFIKYNGLLRIAKLICGIQSYKCEVIQVPQIENEWCATVVAKYTFGKTWDTTFTWEGAADCRASSAAPGFDKYIVALCETRAKARALRDMLGIAICSIEEIAKPFEKQQERQFITENSVEMAETTQLMLIEKKFIGEAGKTIGDICAIVDRHISNISELTKEEASNVLEVFNKSKSKSKKA